MAGLTVTARDRGLRVEAFQRFRGRVVERREPDLGVQSVCQPLNLDSPVLAVHFRTFFRQAAFSSSVGSCLQAAIPFAIASIARAFAFS